MALKCKSKYMLSNVDGLHWNDIVIAVMHEKNKNLSYEIN